MQIRKAKKEDALGIAEVHVKSWIETYTGIVSPKFLESLKVEKRLMLWEKILSSANKEKPVFVAVNDKGKIIGFASFGQERTGKFQAEGELYAIYILKEYQRNKLGLRFLHEGIKEMMEIGFLSMLVWVLEENGNRKFYERLGAEKAGEELDTIGGHEHLELAYVWNDLKSLLQNINSQLKNKNPLE
ncbi:GNAT family N-acetyltransferase [Bacillus sp. REN3]|uniref:GNAT family N-acetyltransferase n=1 Tax=Bacillus sp. REN3 TaxID=2802440 RepID=UPI001AEF093B|nr:GNAT family N-acetyltransferase [Bacillus sp. REN3]